LLLDAALDAPELIVYCLHPAIQFPDPYADMRGQVPVTAVHGNTERVQLACPLVVELRGLAPEVIALDARRHPGRDDGERQAQAAPCDRKQAAGLATHGDGDALAGDDSEVAPLRGGPGDWAIDPRGPGTA
jgi:hypothetical protein